MIINIMKELKNLQFIGFPTLSWDSIFMSKLLQFEYGFVKFSKKELFRQFCKILIVSIISRERYSFEDCKSKILFYQSGVSRINVLECIKNIRSLVRSDLLKTSFGVKDVKLREGFCLLFYYIPSWYKNLRRVGFSYGEIVYTINDLLVLFRLNQAISNINVSTYKLLVTYFDLPTNESYVVELFKSFRIKTVSLQHGQFVSWGADTFMDCGIEFKAFKSDYLLCWNKFTYDEAIRMGIDSSKLVIAGIWSYVNKQRQICKKPGNKIFGVVISHPDWDKENREMILAANIVSEKYGYNYFLKIHPNYSEKAFEGIVNNNCLGNIKSGTSIFDYANSIDFSIVGSSSVYMELAYIEHDVYHYSSGLPKDKYKNIKIGKNFGSPEEFESVYESMKDVNCSRQLFDYLCTVEDVSIEYKRFFTKFE